MPDDKAEKPDYPGENPRPEEITFESPGGADADGEILDVWTGDPEGAALHGELIQSFGGEEGFAVASQDLAEAAGVLDPENEIAAGVESLTRGEEGEVVKQVVAEWRNILASPERAQAALQAIYANPEKSPGREYFRGNASEAVREGITRLWQAAHGEPPTGRPVP